MNENEGRKMSRKKSWEKKTHWKFHNKDISLSPENQVTLLGVTRDSKLNLEVHIQKMCKEASKKLNAFLRTASDLNVAQKKSTDEFIFLFSV